jgi:hypothetical protein
MDSYDADVRAEPLTLAGVYPCPHFEPEWPYLLNDRERAAHPARWTIEGWEKAIPRRLDHAALPSINLAANDVVVSEQKFPPSAIA